MIAAYPPSPRVGVDGPAFAFPPPPPPNEVNFAFFVGLPPSDRLAPDSGSVSGSSISSSSESPVGKESKSTSSNSSPGGSGRCEDELVEGGGDRRRLEGEVGAGVVGLGGFAERWEVVEEGRGVAFVASTGGGVTF